MHDRSHIRRDARRGADALGTCGGALVATGLLISVGTLATATGARSAAAVVGGLVVLIAGVMLLSLASGAWEREASRSGRLPRTAVRWTTSPGSVSAQALVPLTIGSTGQGPGRRRVVSLPYAALPPARG